MVDYIEILRLSHDPTKSQRCIASIVHSSRHTIRDIQNAASVAGISWPLDDSITNEMLKELADWAESLRQVMFAKRVPEK